MELFRRASKVIPGGIYGHASPAAGLPEHFLTMRKKHMGVGTGMLMAANTWTSCNGYGTISLGYGNPIVEEAASANVKKAVSLITLLQ